MGEYSKRDRVKTMGTREREIINAIITDEILR